jgi:hypothetical protein
VIFNGAVNTTVDVEVTIPTSWTDPRCGAASTSVDMDQVGTAVPGWSCTRTKVNGHDVLHWHGPQVGPPPQTEADSAQFFTFPVTMPSPAAQTSYGALGGPEGLSVKQVYADGTTALWRTPNSSQPGTEAPGLVRTVAAAPQATTTTLSEPIARLPHLACEALGAFVGNTVPDGDCSVLSAQMTPPNATGTVQFTDKIKDKTAVLGPVPLRAGGLAVLITTKLATGEHSLTATFTPTDPKAFTPSTSNTVRIHVDGD